MPARSQKLRKKPVCYQISHATLARLRDALALRNAHVQPAQSLNQFVEEAIVRACAAVEKIYSIVLDNGQESA
jgi:hypothetical protein